MPLFIGKALSHGNLPFTRPARCQGQIRAAPRRNPINRLPDRAETADWLDHQEKHHLLSYRPRSAAASQLESS